MDEREIAFAGISGQRQLLTEGRITSTDLLAISRRRIAALDPQLNCFRTLFDSAYDEAAAADQAIARGEDRPLLGVPVAVKDNLAVTGQQALLGTGSPQPPATQDAEVTRRLRAAGAVIVGATNLPELALWPFTESATFGATRNPWDPARTPGGSSGGSAAAVAAGLVSAAHASDGGGSIRIPAACCGLPGLKPGRGLVSLAPDTEHWYGLSSAGVLTRSVADAVTVLNVLQDDPLELSDPRALRIAWSLKAPQPTRLHPDVRSAVARALARLEELGHTTAPADPSYAGVQESFVVRYATGVAQDLRGLADPSKTELRTRAVAAIGRRLEGRALTRANRLGLEARTRLSFLPGGADLLLTPSLPAPARKVGSMTGLRTLAQAGRAVPFTPAWNVTGLPAMAVPAGFTAAGLPLSVQLIGPPGSEQLLLSVAAQLEDWLEHRPPVS